MAAKIRISPKCPQSFWEQRLRCSFYAALNILCNSASVVVPKTLLPAVQLKIFFATAMLNIMQS